MIHQRDMNWTIACSVRLPLIFLTHCSSNKAFATERFFAPLAFTNFSKSGASWLGLLPSIHRSNQKFILSPLPTMHFVAALKRLSFRGNFKLQNGPCSQPTFFLKPPPTDPQSIIEKFDVVQTQTTVFLWLAHLVPSHSVISPICISSTMPQETLANFISSRSFRQ